MRNKKAEGFLYTSVAHKGDIWECVREEFYGNKKIQGDIYLKPEASPEGGFALLMM